MSPVSRELDCIEVVELVTDYLDGALDAGAAADVEAHLAQCPGCDTYVDQIRATSAALGRVPVESLPEQACTDLVEAFRTVHRPGAP